MLDVHPPHAPTHTWHDFLIHIATICIGLLIAVGLEQSVEALHRHHQRIALQADLRTEATSNREIIAHDLNMRSLEPWFDQAAQAADAALPAQGKIRLLLPAPPCFPGSLGTSKMRYFAPSEAVWTTAKESALVHLLPVEQARMYARLAHNYELLAANREDVYRNCSSLSAMQQRFAHATPGTTDLTWTMTSAQADRFAQTAADTRNAIQGLCFRLRWSDVYEQALIDSEVKADERMMKIDQTRFQDPPPPRASLALLPHANPTPANPRCRAGPVKPLTTRKIPKPPINTVNLYFQNLA
jgi:hypothetical protein